MNSKIKRNEEQNTTTTTPRGKRKTSKTIIRTYQHKKSNLDESDRHDLDKRLKDLLEKKEDIYTATRTLRNTATNSYRQERSYFTSALLFQQQQQKQIQQQCIAIRQVRNVRFEDVVTMLEFAEDEDFESPPSKSRIPICDTPKPNLLPRGSYLENTVKLPTRKVRISSPNRGKLKE